MIEKGGKNEPGRVAFSKNVLFYLKGMNILSVIIIETHFNPFMTCGLGHPYYLDKSICTLRGFLSIFILLLYFA